MTFSQKLKELRTEKRLTQDQLSEKTGLSHACIAMLEMDKRAPNSSTLIQLADFFECSTDYLLGRSDDFGVISIHSQKEKPASALSQDEQKIINDYRSLPPDLKHRAAAYMEKLVELDAEEQQTHFSTSNNRINGKKATRA